MSFLLFQGGGGVEGLFSKKPETLFSRKMYSLSRIRSSEISWKICFCFSFAFRWMRRKEVKVKELFFCQWTMV